MGRLTEYKERTDAATIGLEVCLYLEVGKTRNDVINKGKVTKIVDRTKVKVDWGEGKGGEKEHLMKDLWCDLSITAMETRNKEQEQQRQQQQAAAAAAEEEEDEVTRNKRSRDELSMTSSPMRSNKKNKEEKNKEEEEEVDDNNANELSMISKDGKIS